MKTLQSTVTAGVAAFLFAALFAGTANARCVGTAPHTRSRVGANPAFAAPMVNPPAPSLKPEATLPLIEASIAGFWYVQFTAGGQLVDDGFDIWHNDGMEVLNDTSAPSSGAVCVGIWTKVDALTYVVKHPTWIFDDAGVNLIGVAVIREKISLDPSGNTYKGTSTFDLYDLSGNLLDEEVSQVSATRINAVDDAAAPATPIPGLPAAILKR